MKKHLAIVYIILSACSSDKSVELVKSAEAYLKEQMKDPSSYQVIKSEILDTTMKREYLEKQYRLDTIRVALTKLENQEKMRKMDFGVGEEKEKADYEKILQKMVVLHQGAADDHLNELKKLVQDSIYFITINISYRAKNGFGALDKESKNIKYYPSDRTFKVVD